MTVFCCEIARQKRRKQQAVFNPNQNYQSYRASSTIPRTYALMATSLSIAPRTTQFVLGEHTNPRYGVRFLRGDFTIPLESLKRSRANRLRPKLDLDQHLQHPNWANDTRRTVLLPRRQIYPERKPRLQELRRVARLVL
jgi:hypothetical protein